MVLFKLTTSFAGSNFSPKKLKTFFSETDFIIDISNSNAETNFFSFIPKKMFCTQANISRYLCYIFNIIAKYYDFLKEIGMESIVIYAEVYYQGYQCNFELFDTQFVHNIVKYRVEVPLSIYKITAKDFNSISKVNALNYNE